MFSTIFCIVSEGMLGLTSRWQSAGQMLRFSLPVTENQLNNSKSLKIKAVKSGGSEKKKCK